MFRRHSPYLWLSVLVALYLILSLTLPVSQQVLDTMHVNLYQYRIYMSSILVPYCLIWFAAFYAYVQMQSYATLLGSAKEARAFRHISKGLKIMAWGLAVPAIISVILLSLTVKHTDFLDTVTIINNYIALLVPLFAFTIIGNGSRILSELTKQKVSPIIIRLSVLAFIAFAVFSTHFTLEEYHDDGNPYYLSHLMIVLTLIIPYLYVWFLGFFASFQISRYAQQVKGLLYKRALDLVSTGITIVIVSTIFIQYITIGFASHKDLTATPVVLMVYIYIVLQAIGFVSISIGAKRLKRIEEI